MDNVVVIDFETRSAEEIKYGAAKYSEHATTEIMCIAYILPGREEAELWHPETGDMPESGDLTPLFDHIISGGLVEAHNAQFERAIWENVAVAHLGWPVVAPDKWRCSASVCASRALPRSLKGAAEALGLEQAKDDKGSRMMLKLSKPRGILKADLEPLAEQLGVDDWKSLRQSGDTVFKLRTRYPEVGYLQGLNPWHEKTEELQVLFDYCQQDVRVEKAISDRLGHLTESELLTWQVDQQINFTGVPLDLDMVDRAMDLADACVEQAGEQLAAITDGAVTSPTQAAKIKKFVEGEGFPLESCAKGVLEDILKNQQRELTEAAREVIEIRLAMAKSSTAKYVAMKNTAGRDGRVRGTLAYHGADTGRWAGRLIQTQNFPRGTVKAEPDHLADAVLNMSREDIDLFYGNTMEVLSSALRGAICAPEGREFICADYSAIEARVGFWLAGDEKALQVFRMGGDIYKDMAGQIYGVTADQVTPEQRQVGKAAILGLGFQMGPEKFSYTCMTNGMDLDEEFCEGVVKSYRSLHAPVKQGWYDIENGVLNAVRTPGMRVPIWNGKLTAFVEEDFLNVQLPGGRCLSYYKPFVKSVYSERFDSWSDKIHFWGTNGVTRKFEVQTTYGGKLTENAVQATARDLMRDAMVRLHEHPDYDIVMSVHDELVCEVDEGVGSVEELETIMSEKAEWAEGLPVEAEGWKGRRFRK